MKTRTVEYEARLIWRELEAGSKFQTVSTYRRGVGCRTVATEVSSTLLQVDNFRRFIPLKTVR